MGNSIYCKQCKHKHKGVGICCGTNNINNSICPQCLHKHYGTMQCCCKLEGTETIEKTREVSNGVRHYSEYEDFTIGYKTVIKDVAVEEPYTLMETVMEQQSERVLVTKWKQEDYTDWETRTVQSYSQYQGFNGNVSYSTERYPVSKTRQVSYQDYETQYKSVPVMKEVTHYTTTYVKKEVEEPITERRLVAKTKQLYKTEKYTETIDKVCKCKSKYSCRCVISQPCGSDGPLSYGTCVDSYHAWGDVGNEQRGMTYHGECHHMYISSRRSMPWKYHLKIWQYEREQRKKKEEERRKKEAKEIEYLKERKRIYQVNVKRQDVVTFSVTKYIKMFVDLFTQSDRVQLKEDRDCDF